MQFTIGAGGGRADNKGRFEEWNAKVETGANFWKAKAVFPIAMFQMNNLSLYFNVCRYSEARGEYVTWADLTRTFHEVENYGLLLLDDYSRVYFAETGIFPEKEFTRREFEFAMEKLRIPAHSIQHGPWLTNPLEDGMTISFGSAGSCGAFLEYRQENSENWNRVPFDQRDGILIRNHRIHVLHLKGLNPGTGYQYRISTLHPITAQETVSGIYEFRTLDPERENFTFTALSDLHSNIQMIRKLLQHNALNDSDFLINIGDYLSCACGEESYYNGFLDQEAEWSRKNGKALIFARGNHEQIGTFAGLFQELLPTPDGKSYFTFRQGETLFLTLDAGNDKPDDPEGLFHNGEMLKEQQDWLRKIVQTKEYRSARWRIILIHMPPCDVEKYDSNAAYSLIRICSESGVVPDLILSGHLHKYLKIIPETGVCSYLREDRSEPVTLPLPCPLLANDTDTLIRVEVRKTELSAEVIDCHGTTIDQISLEKQ